MSLASAPELPLLPPRRRRPVVLALSVARARAPARPPVRSTARSTVRLPEWNTGDGISAAYYSAASGRVHPLNWLLIVFDAFPLTTWRQIYLRLLVVVVVVVSGVVVVVGAAAKLGRDSNARGLRD